MIKIFILVYVMNTSPSETLDSFALKQEFNTMDECKWELLKNTYYPFVNNVYDVVIDFIQDKEYKYDWIFAKCRDTNTGDEYLIEPVYDYGIPKEIQEIRNQIHVQN